MMFLSVSSHAQEDGIITDSTSIFSVVEVLDEALMTAEKSRVVYRLDRQKLSGSASLSSEGGTAVDVLRSIPSVRVDSEGEVSFRGSKGYLVYIPDPDLDDPRPSEISEHSTFPHLLLQRRRPA